MALKRKKHPWYSFQKVNSYNAVFNFIIGERGNGKTYGAKKQAIRKAIRTGEEFIYLRRYNSEMVARHTFFADIADEFPKHDFRVHGNLGQVASASSRDKEKRAWKTICYFIPLSKAQSQKSVSFHNVTTIIFDEFILEKSMLRYLPDEVKIFLNFYSTVDRNQDKTRVYFLANSVSIMNPYFLEYKILPDEMEEITVLHGGFMLFHFIDSKDFSDSVYQTRFGKFIQGSEYAKYAVDNNFADNHNSLLEMKSERAKYFYTLETKTGILSIWYDHVSNQWFAQQKRPRNENLLTTVPELMSDEKTLTPINGNLMGMLRTAFRHGRIYFDSAVSRNIFVEVFKK